MSFRKEFVPEIDFFTIGVSTIGGTDIIKGDGNVVQEWDKYVYDDYSDRVISVEWSRQEDFPYSVAMATADITMDNHDDFFTPDAGSDIENFILPSRPVRIHSGFSGENIPAFIGLTEKAPELDRKNKTVKFHCIDFLSSLYEKPLDEAVIYEDMRIDEILDNLLQLVGLTPTQYELDEAFNTVSFAYFNKGDKFGNIVKKLVQADLGSLFMSESGVITFRNRQNFDDTSVFTFNDTNTNEFITKKDDDIINVVEVRSDVREVQPNQKIWESSQATLVNASSSVEIWADFSDPVTSVDDPVFILSATTSLFDANLESDGSGTQYTNFTLVSTDLFSTSFKMTFQNTGASPAYITKIQLFGTPAKVVSKVYVREQNDDSVDKYGERVLPIENNYIQESSTATSLALIILGQNSEYGSVEELDVKGTPALQLGDQITSAFPGDSTTDYAPYGILMSITKPITDMNVVGGDFAITKIENQLAGGNYKQVLTVKPRTSFSYFTIGVSTIGGEDVIAP